MTDSLRHNITAFNSMIADGVNNKQSILDAMKRFYHTDVEVRENAETCTVGLESNLKREGDMLKITTWHQMKIVDVAIGDETTMVHWDMIFEYEQFPEVVSGPVVAIQKWSAGKIVKETFIFHHAGQFPEQYHVPASS